VSLLKDRLCSEIDAPEVQLMRPKNSEAVSATVIVWELKYECWIIVENDIMRNLRWSILFDGKLWVVNNNYCEWWFILREFLFYTSTVTQLKPIWSKPQNDQCKFQTAIRSLEDWIHATGASMPFCFAELKCLIMIMHWLSWPQSQIHNKDWLQCPVYLKIIKTLDNYRSWMVMVVESVPLLSLLSNKASSSYMQKLQRLQSWSIKNSKNWGIGQKYSDALFILYTMIVCQIITDQISRSTFIVKAVQIPTAWVLSKQINWRIPLRFDEIKIDLQERWGLVIRKLFVR
jgi:hypothetical protein